MNTLNLVIGIILGGIGIFMLFFMDYKDEEPDIWSISHLFIALAFTVVGWALFGMCVESRRTETQSNEQYLIFPMPNTIDSTRPIAPSTDSIIEWRMDGAVYELNGNTLIRVK